MTLTASTAQPTALEWFEALDYATAHGTLLASGEATAEREFFGDVVLIGRLSEAIRRLNPAIPEEARATIRQFRRVQIERRTNR